jgi:hypothetical protein
MMKVLALSDSGEKSIQIFHGKALFQTVIKMLQHPHSVEAE